MIRAGARAVLACGLAACVGCATVHRSPPSPRIQLGVDGGLFYLKDGRKTSVGPLGGDLPSLVAGNDEAVRFARRARGELAIGVPMYLAGAALIIVGLVVDKPTGWAVVGGGGAVAVSGVGVMGAGVVNLIDAVNAYNDAVVSDRISATGVDGDRQFSR